MGRSYCRRLRRSSLLWTRVEMIRLVTTLDADHSVVDGRMQKSHVEEVFWDRLGRIGQKCLLRKLVPLQRPALGRLTCSAVSFAVAVAGAATISEVSRTTRRTLGAISSLDMSLFSVQFQVDCCLSENSRSTPDWPISAFLDCRAALAPRASVS